MHDEKYVVFKREDWNNFVARIPDDTMTLRQIDHTPDAIGDAVVIRTQDIFAAAGLSAYAYNIRNYAGALHGLGLSELAENLTRIAAYFFEVATEADDRLARGECKLPD